MPAQSHRHRHQGQGQGHAHRCQNGPQQRGGSKQHRTLDQMTPGERGKIHAHRAQGAVRQRLLDLGLHPKAEVTMVRVAPLGDPIELKLDACLIALRRAEAMLIDVHAA